MALPPASPDRQPRAVAQLQEFRGRNAHGAIPVLRFQYWPSTLGIGRSVNYEGNQIPGASHPLYQFVSGGDRAISFTAVFSNERPTLIGQAQLGNKYSVDINDVLLALYRYTLPHYEFNSGDQLFVRPPYRLLLTLPGTFLAGVNNAQLLTIMTQCDIEYQAWHPDGTPRLATASLSFNEVVSGPDGIKYRDRDEMESAAFNHSRRVVEVPVRGG